eukprot:Sspe_Gene.22173::Locus_8389_Transcript_3_3_Confidence_0.714_Length_2043::g.22173::m.22173
MKSGVVLLLSIPPLVLFATFTGGGWDPPLPPPPLSPTTLPSAAPLPQPLPSALGYAQSELRLGGLRDEDKVPRYLLPPDPLWSRNPNESVFNLSPAAGVDVRWRQYQHASATFGYMPSETSTPSDMVCRDVTSPELRAARGRLQLCQDSTGCTGSFDFTPEAGYPCPTKALGKATTEASYAAWLEAVGPLVHRIRLIGPEVVLPVPRHEGRCRYRHLFHVNLPGVYRIEGEELYRDFRAFDEITPDTPPLTRIPLLDLNETRTKEKVIAGAQHHDPKKNLWAWSDPVLGRELRRSRFRSSKFFIWDQFTLQAKQTITCSVSSPPTSLPPCGPSTPPASGRWVHTGRARPLPPPPAFTHFERSSPLNLYTWIPFNCKLPAVTQRDALKCFEGRRVVFTGDSHNRVTYTHLANFLRRPDPPLDPEVKMMNGRSLVVGMNTSLDLLNDVLMEKHSLGRLSQQYDVVVAGFGSWALGGGGKDQQGRVKEDFGRWKRSQYISAVERIAKSAAEGMKGRRAARVVWLTVPAYPINQRRFAKMKGEYRTNPRLEKFNRDAAAVLTKYNITVVDTFSPSHPMVHLSIDHNHHIGYVQDAILHSLLAVLCGETHP